MSYQRNYVQNLINGFMSTIVIYTGCELGIFDALKNSSKSVEILSQDIGITISELLRIVRPLEQYKLLQIKNNELTLLEVGETLVSDNVGSLKAYALFCGRESLIAWGGMYPALKKRVSPRELLSKSHIFNDIEGSDELFQTFNEMMSAVSMQLDLTDFFKGFIEKNKEIKVVDVGGGTGTIIKKFLGYYKNATGTILDLAQARDTALKNLKENNMDYRCTFKETDFFKVIEEEADVFILSRVLHDWKDAEVSQILRNVANAMNDNSKLVVLEEIIRNANEPNAIRSYMNDIQMWVFCDGKERTLQEFSNLFKAVGLNIDSTFDTKEGTAVIIAVKENEETGEL